jgi:hypothetical protein
MLVSGGSGKRRESVSGAIAIGFFSRRTAAKVFPFSNVPRGSAFDVLPPSGCRWVLPAERLHLGTAPWPHRRPLATTRSGVALAMGIVVVDDSPETDLLKQ